MFNEIIGIQETTYNFENGSVSGRKVYFTFALDGDKATGIGCSSVFLSNNKFGGYNLNIGDRFRIAYNQYRKPDFLVFE